MTKAADAFPATGVKEMSSKTQWTNLNEWQILAIIEALRHSEATGFIEKTSLQSLANFLEGCKQIKVR